MLKNAETFEIMRPADVGLAETNIVMGKHSGRAALRSKLKDLGYELAENQLNDVFVRFKELADRKKEVYDEDLIALCAPRTTQREDRLVIKSLRVVCGTEGPQQAALTMVIDGAEHSTEATGDGPVDASFNAVKALFPHDARLQLYQVHAVTEGTDAQATVSVRHGGRRAHRDRSVGRYRHGRRLGQSLCPRTEPPDRAAREGRQGHARSQLQGRKLGRAPRLLADKSAQGFSRKPLGRS